MFLSGIFNGLVITGAIAFSILTISPIEPLGTAVWKDVITQNQPKLEEALQAKKLTLGAPIYMRIFKEESELEVWIKDGETYSLIKTWPICTWSGHLGPKLKEGDHQSPEGFYSVSRGAMNPNSNYHLSFNLGFPNAYDRSLGRTGSYLMVHGNCLSVGCYAMTDDGIEEIYLLADEALKAGQKRFQVHAFPFRMTSHNMERYRDHEWFSFWQQLKPGFDKFEETKIPPKIKVDDKRYYLEGS